MTGTSQVQYANSMVLYCCWVLPQQAVLHERQQMIACRCVKQCPMSKLPNVIALGQHS